MKTINWQITNLSCASCVTTIQKALHKKQQQNIQINLLDGRVSFQHNANVSAQDLQKTIEQLGYKVLPQLQSTHNHNSHQEHEHNHSPSNVNHYLIKCLISALLTLPLLGHMFFDITILHNISFQFSLALPVYILGIYSFGNSALKSIKNGSPNMNVLIVLGTSAAFFYSTIGCFILENKNYLFFETSSSIFTFIFLGSWLEAKSLQITQKSIKALLNSQPTKANLIAIENGKEIIKEILASELQTEQNVLIKTGDKVPADAIIFWGEGKFNEALITGESLPINKTIGTKIIGGSILEQGNIKAKILNVGEQSVLGQIIKHVRAAEMEKPQIQNLADKISAFFVPLVLFIAGITFLINFYVVAHDLENSLMRAVAVLVIACPCALGLATPAAISIGLGRAAHYGILFKKIKSLEVFKNIKQIAFDKTGILTTGNFRIAEIELKNITNNEFSKILYSIELHSNHPISKSICTQLKTNEEIKWKSLDEIKGTGIKAIDQNGDEYFLGSHKIIAHIPDTPKNKTAYLLKNNNLLGWIDMQDEIRPEATDVLNFFRKKQIKICMISGDNESKCKYVANQLGITDYYFEQTPEMKLKLITDLIDKHPVAMVGDGINDSPALAKATVGITINGASQISVQAASVVLMQPSLSQLPNALSLGKHTYQTIKENLAWAFLYNFLSIPIAAMGFLSPGFSALIMAGSDVILALNSVRLLVKKLK